MIKNFINKIENSKISFWKIIFLLYTASFIRTFLENYVNLHNHYHMSGFIDTFFHYPLWFIGVFLSVFIIARILTKERIEKIARLIAISSFIIIIPPIIDLIINKGRQISYAFPGGDYNRFFKIFFSFLGDGTVGIGIRTEVALALIGLGFYIFHKTKKLQRSIIGAFLLYLVIFMAGALPAGIFSIKNLISNDNKTINAQSISNFYYSEEPSNTVTNQRTFVSEKNTFEPKMLQKINNQYTTTLSMVFLCINVLLLVWCFFLYSPRKLFAVFKNFRFLRIIHYYILLSLGIYLGIHVSGKTPIGSLFDLMSFVSLFLSFLFAGLFSVWENDEVDVEIDKKSNKDRPLAKNIFNITEWINLKYLFLFISLNFAFLNGLYSFVFILLFILIYHIYSAPPLRLKKFIGISSLLIASNALLTILMGFFLSSGTEDLSAFPVKYIFGILVIFILAENVKNIKDIKGDKKEGIKTLPVIFGEKNGKLITGILLFFSVIIVPFIILFNLYTFSAAVFFGLILFLLTNRKRFKEKYIFLTYFAFVIIFLILMKI